MSNSFHYKVEFDSEKTSALALDFFRKNKKLREVASIYCDYGEDEMPADLIETDGNVWKFGSAGCCSDDIGVIRSGTEYFLRSTRTENTNSASNSLWKDIFRRINTGVGRRKFCSRLYLH